MSSNPPRKEPSDLVVITLVSCSMLAYEILLTRISALRLLFHYSFLVVSNCLLGLGASGAVIALNRESWEREAGEKIFRFAAYYFGSLVLVYPFVLTFPLWPGLALSPSPDPLRFSVFNLVVAAPFFFAGLVIGMILTAGAARVNLLYGLDLLGASLGCVLCPLLLPTVGAGGCFVLVALLAAAAAAAAVPLRWRKPVLVAGGAIAAIGLSLMSRLDQIFPVPGKGALSITKQLTAKLGLEIEYSKWTANSRIDMIAVPSRQRFVYTLGSKARDYPLPEEKLILQDGSAGTFVLDWSGHPEMLEVLRHSTYAAAMTLRREARVFIIGAGGGNDVWAAKTMGASRVKAIELNEPILDIHRSRLSSWSKGLLEDPRIELVHGEGRSALLRETGRYDVIMMSGIDTWTALASGAYMLAENYLYTREAIESMLDHLVERGILQIIRMSAEMETLRLLSNVHAAFERRGMPGFEDSVVCLGTPDSLVAVLVMRGRFAREELARLARFADEAGVAPLYVPGASLGTRAEQFVLTNDKAAFVRAFPRNLTPTTDDRPYFFNYTKWKNPFAAAAYLDEPTAVSQGNPLFILGQLSLSIFLGVGLIVLPLAWSKRRRADPRHVRPFLAYFAGLGAGFIAIEIVMMQKLTLFLGHPLYSVTVTLFAMLLFTGLGSLVSRRWFRSNARAAWGVPTGLALLVGGFALAAPAFVAGFIGLPLPARIALTVTVLAPIGLLLGIPFAFGIRLLDRLNPTLVPWAWAVNGCCTVIGSILTVVLSMNFGFNFVLAAALFAYFVSFLAISRLPQVDAGAPSDRR